MHVAHPCSSLFPRHRVQPRWLKARNTEVRLLQNQEGRAVSPVTSSSKGLHPEFQKKRSRQSCALPPPHPGPPLVLTQAFGDKQTETTAPGPGMKH